jgi:hypothetical protein
MGQSRRPRQGDMVLNFRSCPCRKLTLEHIGGVGRLGLALKAHGPFSKRYVGPARPSVKRDACGPHCNIFGLNLADDEDALRRTPGHDRGSPGGSNQ